MLVFLAAMVGFCLTGDLFNLVVFFELMGAVAYALTAYQIEERGPIQGAINFAITNSVGAYAIFIGVALLYARTGALNMAQIGAALDGHQPDALVIVAMVLLFLGFLTKAAAVPVHFWLGGRARGGADAGVRPVLRRDGRARACTPSRACTGRSSPARWVRTPTSCGRS